MHVANTFRTWNGPPKFCIKLEAGWLIILDEAPGKSPGYVLSKSFGPIRSWNRDIQMFKTLSVGSIVFYRE